MARGNLNTLPSLRKSASNEYWLKESSIWQAKPLKILTKKEGQNVFLNLEGMAHKSVLELDVNDISTDAGAANLTFLEKSYLQDKTQTAHEALKKCE